MNSLFKRPVLTALLAISLVSGVAPVMAAPESAVSEAAKLTRNDLKGLSPSESYLKVHDFILQAQSINDVKPLLAADAMKNDKDMPPEMEGEMFKLMKSMMNPRVKITSESIDGDKAVLTAVPLEQSAMDKGMKEGLANMANMFKDALGEAGLKPENARDALTREPAIEKEVTTGTITMHKEDGVWLQLKESWKTTIGNSSDGDKQEDKAPAEEEKATDSVGAE
ncbi:MAG: hypothetical protein AB7W16_11730 [Candidatus Obscuribacterales bacterium]